MGAGQSARVRAPLCSSIPLVTAQKPRTLKLFPPIPSRPPPRAPPRSLHSPDATSSQPMAPPGLLLLSTIPFPRPHAASLRHRRCGCARQKEWLRWWQMHEEEEEVVVMEARRRSWPAGTRRQAAARLVGAEVRERGVAVEWAVRRARRWRGRVGGARAAVLRQRGSPAMQCWPWRTPDPLLLAAAKALLAIDLPRCFSPQMVLSWPDRFKRQEKIPSSLSKRASLHSRPRVALDLHRSLYLLF